MKTVLLASFDDREPAEALSRRLTAAGHQSIVSQETRLERFGFLAKPRADIHVRVDRDALQPARRLVGEWDQKEGVLAKAVRCPECGSPRVEFPQTTRKFILPALLGVLMALRLLPRHFFCLDCQYTWPEGAPRRSQQDVLGWPKDSGS